jgi:hypothetical protein
MEKLNDVQAVMERLKSVADEMEALMSGPNMSEVSMSLLLCAQAVVWLNMIIQKEKGN